MKELDISKISIEELEKRFNEAFNQLNNEIDEVIIRINNR